MLRQARIGWMFLFEKMSRSPHAVRRQGIWCLRHMQVRRRNLRTSAAVTRWAANDIGRRDHEGVEGDFMWTQAGANTYSRTNLADQKNAMMKNPEKAFQVRLDDQEIDSAYASLFPAVSTNNLMFFPQATAKSLALPDAIQDRVNDEQVLAVRDAKRNWDSIVTKLSETGLNGILRDDVTQFVNLLPVDVRARRGEELMNMIKVGLAHVACCFAGDLC
ncbi:hypothetical protein V1523DRAFT_408966 [Lipomyces doorenjongii]